MIARWNDTLDGKPDQDRFARAAVRRACAKASGCRDVTARERRARRLRVLLARIRRESDTAGEVYARVRGAAERVDAEGRDDVTIGAVVIYLQNFYTAVEEILERIATELDGSVPTGTEWHRELIEQLSVEVPELRPPVLSDALRRDLDLLRRFRHVVRHAYAEPYDWSAMREPVAAADRVSTELPSTLERFYEFLTAMIESLEDE